MVIALTDKTLSRPTVRERKKNAGPSIRFVTRKWPPAVGGMETYSARLVESLRELAEVGVIALPGQENGSPPSAAMLTCFGLVTAARLLFSTPTEIIHIGDMATWPLAWIARLRSRPTRVALSAHGTDVSFPLRNGLAARLYGLYLKLGAKLLPSAVVIANSTTTAQTAKTYGFAHVTVVPLATDVQDNPATGKHGTSLLFVGRLTPRKGCAWFIKNVLPLLPEDMTLRVAGTVWNEKELAALNDPRVEFLGPIYGQDLRREYASALCVVIPNIDVATREFEGFGLIALEAAAAGGLVLASCHSGLREAVIDGETGFQLPPGVPGPWVEKIRDIGNWPDERRNAFLANAITTIKQHFSWERVARETLMAYSQSLPAQSQNHADRATGKSAA
jgi:glycosyltransferase involved in cell wall biosynthesis